MFYPQSSATKPCFQENCDFAGVITEIPENNGGFKIGDEVFGATGHGCLAEKIAISPQKLKSKPKSISFQVAAGLSTTYGTSYYALKQRAQLSKGETLLVLGAAGGVGLAAVQLGKIMGAKVIAAASSTKKLQIAKSHGADELIDYSDGKLKEKVKALTDGKGADVIYDPVGGEVFDESLRCIAWGGRLLVVGFADGRIPVAPANRILIKGCSVVGVRAGEYGRRDPEKGEKASQSILKLARDGLLIPQIHTKLPLTQVAEAMDQISRREVIGKVVLTP